MIDPPNNTLSIAQPLIYVLRALGHKVFVDDEINDPKGPIWLDVEPLCVEVRADRGYGLYLDQDIAMFRGPDEVYTFGQLELLLERMLGLFKEGPASMTDSTLVYVPSGLPRRYCEAGNPMPMADKDKYQWGHPDAVEVAPLYNLMIYRCPHCGLHFHAPARTKEEPS